MSSHQVWLQAKTKDTRNKLNLQTLMDIAGIENG